MAEANSIVVALEAENNAGAALSELISAVKEASAAIKGLNKSTRQTKTVIKDTTNAIKAQTSAFKKLASSIGRIAFYRAIRTGLKAITQGAREGINNLVLYSQVLSNLDSAHATQTMSEFATTALYVKNSVGAALMPILQMLVPIVNAIADAFITAANAVNQFFHALKGESVFTKAKRYAVDYADGLQKASGAAKELKKQIFGFDELNIFNAPSSGGGGGGTPALDYSKMFEEAELSATMKHIRDTIEKNLGQDFVARFKVNWKEIRWKWDNLNPEDVAEKAITGLTAFLGGITGFTLTGSLAGGLVGAVAGETLGVYFSTIMLDGDGEVSENELKEMLRTAAITLTGGIIGWNIAGKEGAVLGASIGATLSALIKTFSPEPAAQENAMALMGYIAAVVTAMIKAAPAIAVGKNVGIGSLPLLVAAGLTLNIMQLLYSANFKDTRQRIGTAIAQAINIIAAGAILGAVFGGGIGGALIGIAIGISLNLIINSIDWSGVDAVSKRAQERLDSQIDIKAVEAYKNNGQKGVDLYLTSGETNKEKKKLLQSRGYADGGFVQGSTYFYAGEQGPELVGTVAGRTHVTNQEQFTAGMVDIMDNTNTVIMQAAQALIQAIQSKPVPSIRIGDRDIVSMYDRGKTLAGGALVE